MIEKNHRSIFSVRLTSGRFVCFVSSDFNNYFKYVECEVEAVLKNMLNVFLRQFIPDHFNDIKEGDDVVDMIDSISEVPMYHTDLEEKLLEVSRLKQNHIVTIFNFLSRGEKTFRTENECKKSVPVTEESGEKEMIIHFVNEDVLKLIVENFNFHDKLRDEFLLIPQNKGESYLIVMDKVTFIEIKDL